ncbi:MAG: MepB family protein [Hyphomicrobiales bacterium]|nr:MAG: MepB family protein [Hyphomicrobiales bacterium]
MSNQTIFSQNLSFIQKQLYQPLNFTISHATKDKESNEYGAGTYKLNQLTIITRTAKITPKKIGQFVAIWQRDQQGITQPQHIDDKFDLLVINCANGDKFGQFVFPKTALAKHGIISTTQKRGKNGIRVYPSWDKAINKQAVKTQNWQLGYFLEFSLEIDLGRAKQLYSEQAV